MGTLTVSTTGTVNRLESGETLAEYEILNLLGSGPEGPVYRVSNTTSFRVEAMKVLRPDLAADSAWADRVLRETSSWASLTHPNIAAPRSARRIDGQLVLFTEFVKGTTLEALLQASRIPLKDAVGYISQVLCGLSHAHSMGLLHRDIKPTNIMVTAEGTVKLVDFSVAALANGRTWREAGATAHYMAPESIESHYFDQRSDIYSLGVILYQLVTGRRPFEGTEEQITTAHLKSPPRPPHDINRSLPVELNDIILIALAKVPAERFQTAAAFHTALSRVALPTEAPPGRGAKAVSPRLWHGSHVSYGTANLLILLPVLGGIAVVGIPKYQRTHPRSQPVAFTPDVRPAVLPSLARSASTAVNRVAGGATSRTLPQFRSTVAPRVARAERAEPREFAAPFAVAGPASSSQFTPSPPVRVTSLAELHARMARSSARAAMVATQLQDPKRQRVAIPPTILAAITRLRSDIEGAAASLDRNDVISAKLTLDAVDRDLDQIEGFLKQ